MLIRRVLIVDDEQILRKLMADVLSRYDFEVVLAENGVEALEALQENPAFDLIITDFQMPKMDGLSLLREIRQDYPHIPVMMSSVHSANSHIKMILQEGAAFFLPRPFTARQLADAVNTVVKISG